MDRTRSHLVVIAFVAASAIACGGGAVGADRAAVASIAITPNAPTLEAGRIAQLTAEPRDGAGHALSGRTMFWSSESPDVATVNGSGVVTGLRPGTTRIAASTEGVSAVVTVTVAARAAATITLTPDGGAMVVGDQLTLAAAVRDASGATLPSASVAWESATPAVASVSGNGVVIALAPGVARITAASGNASATAVITVSDRAVAAVVIDPPADTITVGQATQLAALAQADDGAVLPGRVVIWSSSDQTVAIVSSSGRVTGLAPGTATITASCEGTTARAVVEVVAAPVATIIVAPAQLSLQIGEQATIAVELRDAKGGLLSGRAVAFETSDAAVATISAEGAVTAVAAGSARVTATSEGRSGTANVVIAPVAVSSVTVAPASLSLALGQSSTLTATARAADGTTLIGRTVSWSSAASLVSVTQTGVVSAVRPGTAVVLATIDGVAGSATVFVQPPGVASVTITPSTVTLPPLGQATLAARIVDQAGSIVTNQPVAWSTSNPAVALMSSVGVVTALLPGSATITARAGGVSGTATVTVAPLAPVVANVVVSPSRASVKRGKTQQLAAIATDAQGQRISGATLTWRSGDSAIAAVSPSGLVTARAKGTVQIIATATGTSGSATITVK